MATKKVDTGGETLSEEIKEHRELMKKNPKFRAAMGTRMKGKNDRKSMGKR